MTLRAPAGVRNFVVGPAGVDLLIQGLSVAEAIELARTMGELPAKLVVYGIEGLDFSPDTELSPEVAEVVPAAASLILQEILQLPAAGSARTV